MKAETARQKTEMMFILVLLLVLAADEIFVVASIYTAGSDFRIRARGRKNSGTR